MIKTWQLQEAKAKLSEVVKAACHNGPQPISVHGKQIVVMISRETYDELTKPKQTFIEFIQSSPLKDVKLNIKRDKSTTRDIDL